MPLTLGQRKQIANDTVDRSASIVSNTPGASSSSTFISLQDLAPLNAAQSPGYGETAVDIVNADAFTAARSIAAREGKADVQGQIAVLNLASDVIPGGGWIHSLSKTQEEALCYSSTLYETLKPSYYPWPNIGPSSRAGIYSPGVVVFKDDLDHDCAELAVDDRLVVSVITVAAPRYPDLTNTAAGEVTFQDMTVLDDLRGKIRLVYRMAGHYGQQYLVLGAMGCGAYLCPPELVAREMKTILLDPEFKGWFKRVVFAIYSTPSNGGNNFAVFEQVLRDVKLNANA